eukprot:gene24764-biopygen11941
MARAVDGRMGGAVRGGGVGDFRDFPGARNSFSGAQIRASRRASAPTRRTARARGGGGWDRRLVQFSNDGLGPHFSSFLASGWRKRCPGTWVQKKCVFFFGILVVESRTKTAFLAVFAFSHFCHDCELFRAISCFRIAMRTAARARSGPANDMDEIRE